MNRLSLAGGCLLVASLLTPTSPASAQPPAERIEVYPPRVLLASKRAQTQLVVTGFFKNGETRDLTRKATYAVSNADIARVKRSVLQPFADGEVTLTVTVDGRTAAVPVRVINQAQPDPIRFQYETLAVITRQGCNAGSCHGSPQGKGGFMLSMFAYDPLKDEENLVRGGLNRRINVIAPAESLLLRKPTLRVAHVGGKKLSKDDIAYQILHDWIFEGGRPDSPKTPACTDIIVHPHPARVLRFPHVEQQLSVLARFADGTSRDVTAIASYDVSDKEVLGVDPSGLVTGLKRGQAAVSIRYLNFVHSVYFTVVQDVPGFAWTDPPENNYVDRHVHARLKQLQYVPSDTCSDSVFIRRLHLDLTGLLPTPARVRAFLDDRAPDKRSKLIDDLLDAPEFARFWALKTADLMRVHPRNLKEGRAELFANWIYEAYRKNLPFDRFATDILTARGDTLTNAPANYFLGAPNNEELTEATTQLFMGSRINCAKCHNHPFDSWTQDDYYRINAVFGRIQKDTAFITVALTGETKNPTTGKVVRPWGAEAKDAAADRRAGFAHWLTSPGNPYFARVEANRIWAHLLGRGIVHPVDDFRASNPPSNVDLLNALTLDFERSGFDRKHLIRVICNSRTYQRSAATSKFNEGDDQLFSHALVRRLSAEQLQDAVGYVTGALNPAETLAPVRAALEKKVEAEFARLAKDQAKWEADVRAQVLKLPHRAGTWHAIGPFGDAKKEDTSASHPPEQEIDLTKTYAGGKFSWKKRGDWLDGKAFALPAMPGTYYLYRKVFAGEDGPVVLTVDKKTTQKLWLNGQLVLDAQKGGRVAKGAVHRLDVPLRAGDNALLVKVSKPAGNATFAFSLTGSRKSASVPGGLSPEILDILATAPEARTAAQRQQLTHLRREGDGRVRTLRTQLKQLNDRTGYATQRFFPENSEFLKAFGQPKRESACTCERSAEPTVDQALQMLNGTLVFSRVGKDSLQRYAPHKEAFVDELYLAAFARLPSAGERAAVRRYLAGRDFNDALQDVVWAILNTQEFLFQH